MIFCDYVSLFPKGISLNPCLNQLHQGNYKQMICYHTFYVNCLETFCRLASVLPLCVAQGLIFFLSQCNTIHYVHHIIIRPIFNAQIVPNLACGKPFQQIPLSFWPISISHWGLTCSTRCPGPYVPLLSPAQESAISSSSLGSFQRERYLENKTRVLVCV